MPPRGIHRGGDALVRPGPDAGDLGQRPPRRRHRRDQPEQLALVRHDPELEITRAPSAIAQARSATTRPRSCTKIRGVASAADKPPVSPVLSARCRSSASPACDTTP